MTDTKPALRDLIERLERAEGPSRELDAEITFDSFAKPVGKHAVDGGPVGYVWPEVDPSWSLAGRFPGKDRAWFDTVRKREGGETLVIERDGALVLMNDLRVKPFTDSLDAAFKLIPADWWLAGLQECRTSIRFANDEHEPTGKWQAAVQHRNGGRLRSAEATTVVLALVIAALKAREAGNG